MFFGIDFTDKNFFKKIEIFQKILTFLRKPDHSLVS
jgi:hypothetical protein